MANLTTLTAAGSFIKVNALVEVVRIDVVHFSYKVILFEQWFSQVFIRVEDVLSVRRALCIHHSSLSDLNRRALLLNYVTRGDIGYAFTHDNFAEDLKNFIDIIIDLFLKLELMMLAKL